MDRPFSNVPYRTHSRSKSKGRSGYVESLQTEQLEILASLLNKQLSSAILIADGQGEIYWANSFARSVAEKWQLFKTTDTADVKITASNLRRLITIDFAETCGEQVKKYFTAGNMFFEVTKIFSPRKNSPHRLFALEIDCYALKEEDRQLLASLSPAEYRLIQSLENTHSLKETSRVLNISYENSRTKLKSIFHKLNVHSQQELLSKVHHVLNIADFERISARSSHRLPHTHST